LKYKSRKIIRRSLFTQEKLPEYRHKKCGLMPIRRARFNKVKRKEGIEADPQMPAYITPHEELVMRWYD
jgi:hypothetical protein